MKYSVLPTLLPLSRAVPCTCPSISGCSDDPLHIDRPSITGIEHIANNIPTLWRVVQR